ncbi:MAG: T9SS type A sorting domain-containing protein, partial [Alphaproteobacteria bacterium]|nr:T9SS type A sorting domain-containing protein [Alphaproteobacteria bacterium]
EPTFDITTSANGGGTISPSMVVNRNDNMYITYQSHDGYMVDSVFINGVYAENQSDSLGYMFTNMQSHQTMRVVFNLEKPYIAYTNYPSYHVGDTLIVTGSLIEDIKLKKFKDSLYLVPFKKDIINQSIDTNYYFIIPENLNYGLYLIYGRGGNRISKKTLVINIYNHKVNLDSIAYYEWGLDQDSNMTLPVDLPKVLSISQGSKHALALKNDGTVMAWGSNLHGQTHIPHDLNNVVAVSSGVNHSLALKRDGTVVAWGSNHYGQKNVPHGLKNIVSISAGHFHSLALTTEGTVVSWGGRKGYGSTILAHDLKNVVAISGGGLHSLALKADGTVIGWGDNSFGQALIPGFETDLESISAGYLHSLALKSDSTVIAWGHNFNGETIVPSGLNRIVSISAGSNHSVTLQDDGSIKAWGDPFSNVHTYNQDLKNVIGIFSEPSSHYNFAMYKKTNVFDRTPSAKIISIVTTSPNCDSGVGQVEFTINDTSFYDSLSLKNTVTNSINTYSIKQTNLVVHNLNVDQPYEATVFDIRKQFSPRLYSFRIPGVTPLKALSLVESDNQKLVLNLSGATTYTITLNGETWKTQDSKVSVPLVVGMNKLKITSDKTCKDSFEESILISEQLTLYPNPATNYTNIHVGGLEEKVIVTIENDKGVIMLQKEYHLDADRNIHFSLEGYSKGIYLIEVKGNNSKGILKLLKQ